MYVRGGGGIVARIWAMFYSNFSRLPSLSLTALNAVGSAFHFRLPKEAQDCLAGDMQRVAKLMAVKADYEVMRELAKLEAVDQTGQDWDER